MTSEELDLKNIINNCRNESCPLYSAFWNKPNAQGEYRGNQFKWAHNFYPPIFKIGEESFGAKLVLIMESPPPKYLEYFYGPQGESKKLFSNIIKTLFSIEGIPKNLEDKQTILKWFANLGIIVVDAAKCRMKITPQNPYDRGETQSDKISGSEIRRTFNSCSDILQLQLKIINPFKVAIGIASVYDHYIDREPYILRILKELGIENSFVKERTVSVFDRSGEEEFNAWFKKTWLQTKQLLKENGIQ
jgi:hypothetical protein